MTEGASSKCQTDPSLAEANVELRFTRVTQFGFTDMDIWWRFLGMDCALLCMKRLFRVMSGFRFVPDFGIKWLQTSFLENIEANILVVKT